VTDSNSTGHGRTETILRIYALTRASSRRRLVEMALPVRSDFIRALTPGIEVHFLKSINSRVFQLAWTSGMSAMTDCAPVELVAVDSIKLQ
jgi:hypothetical protein